VHVHIPLDNRHQSPAPGILYDRAFNVPSARPCRIWGGVGLHGTALRAIDAFGHVLVGLPAAEVHFVAFDLALRRFGGLAVEVAEFVQHEPGRFLGDLDVPRQLDRRYTLLVVADEVHGHEPLAQQEFGILEDCSDQHGEVAAAPVATEFSILTFHTLDAAAVWVDNVVASALLFENRPTLGLCVEVVGQCEQGVEFGEVCHCSIHC